MESLQASMTTYKQQLQKGDIVRAYRELMAYMLCLRTHFAKTYPDYFVSGSLYTGYMDMTYFAVSPPALNSRIHAIFTIQERCTLINSSRPRSSVSKSQTAPRTKRTHGCSFFGLGG